ncbi:MAG TPA: hypothetical protein VFW83_02710 [Bryobacteraceae bacterium]|nr:hypothetical protein [Bryobacteraceae bacterium]
MQSTGDAARERTMTGLRSDGSAMDRKYWVALALYAVLAILVWFTMDAGKIPVFGRPVDLRLVPLVIIGALALKTILARQAERIRHGADSENNQAHHGQI